MRRLSSADLHQQLLESYAAPSLVANGEYDIIHVSENASRYLKSPSGEPSINLLKVVREELRLELRAALYKAAQQPGREAIKTGNLKINFGEDAETIRIVVRPITSGAASGYFLVLFEQSPEGAATAETGQAESSAAAATDEPLSRLLEAEAAQTRTQLRAAIEHHEVQTEELKASNEELQAMNEELRSSAEELETGKEELQSLNEELSTVNQELKIKVEEVTESSDNFRNLVNSTDIATIFLDRSLRVNIFSPAAARIFNLLPADAGRPLSGE